MSIWVNITNADCYERGPAYHLELKNIGGEDFEGYFSEPRP